VGGPALYIDAAALKCGWVEAHPLTEVECQRRVSFVVPQIDPLRRHVLIPALETGDVIFGLSRGLIGKTQMLLTLLALMGRKRVWYFWTNEASAQRVRLPELRQHIRDWMAAHVIAWLRWKWLRTRLIDETNPAVQAAERVWRDIDRVAKAVRPVPFRHDADGARTTLPARGRGLYLRSDFWVRIRSGGSYGHTCYAAKELAAVTERLTCVMAQRFELLDQLGVEQVVLDAPGESGTDDNILNATEVYFRQLENIIAERKPVYIYERYALGNYAAAKVSQKHDVPLIVEYNGSEISMKRSFDAAGYEFEDLFLVIEDTVLRQATAIVVVSEQIRDTLVRRGIEPGKILINPNGVDPDEYRPASDAEKAGLKRQIGWDAEHVVVGFIGSFGGWHGIEVIAEALPQMCALDANLRVLLIGDGNYRHIVEEAVARHGLGPKVHFTGTVPQHEGAILLRACDIYISPHSRHMVDSRFFGSPTKLFEYMALGGGIVASDLEQIGEVMRPAATVAALPGITRIADERGILARPASVDDLVAGVAWLVRHPELRQAMGTNARNTAIASFSWQQHVARIWAFIDHASGSPLAGAEIAAPLTRRNAEENAAALRGWLDQNAAQRYARSPWLLSRLDHARQSGKHVLEIGPALGHEAVRLARAGASVTVLDINRVNLAETAKNLHLHRLPARQVNGDVETLPFADESFDTVYAINVLSHATAELALDEIWRVLAPGGTAYVSVYSATSLEYYAQHLFKRGMRQGLLDRYSMAEILGRSVDLVGNERRRPIEAFTHTRARRLFGGFRSLRLSAHELNAGVVPAEIGRWLPRFSERWLGRAILVRARKPAAGAAPMRRKPDRRDMVAPSAPLAAELVRANLALEPWLARKTSRPRLHTTLDHETIERLRQMAPNRVAQTTAAGERLLAHELDLLGSGPYTPVDPSRPRRPDGYQPIDWDLDPVRGLRFPRGIPHRAWDLYAMRPANADIKYPWELGRCQHFVTLAQAWRLTGDNRFAQEIFDQIGDFGEANPVGIGVNWTCTMDVAIRAASWAIAVELIEGWLQRAPGRLATVYEALFAHGRFISANLENKYEVTSNHFLSNVVGLQFVAALFSDLPSGRRWERFCRRAVETEIGVQVLDDGADYESSVPYHRLVCELFLAAARLAHYRDTRLSPSYDAKLAKMVDFHFAMLRPDGRMVSVGDGDDGRLHIFTDYGTWDRRDGRHLLAPAAHVLAQSAAPARRDWLAAAGGEAGLWEAAWWGFDPRQVAAGDGAPAPVTKLFPDAGIAVVRAHDTFLAITNGRVGTKGFGNHKHNDQLSFDYMVAGHPLIIDPGSFVYTSDFDARNRFRGSRYHNTVFIDGVEQNDFRADWPFRMFDCGLPEHLAWDAGGDAVRYLGRHIGYRRMAEGVTHDRGFELTISAGLLLIVDRFIGRGRHELRWHFHCGDDVVAVPDGRMVRLAAPGDVQAVLIGAQAQDWTITAGEWSPSYGVRRPCQVVECTETVILDDAPLIRCFAIDTNGRPSDPTRRDMIETKWQATIEHIASVSPAPPR
jgi:glycosyltransferase involved in cell wall biosynthesis/ubiquinone/menaquinone biosynthesis C-methylase UbiE